MVKHKSPGQKRKGIVRVVWLIVFAVSTYAASLVAGFVNTADLDWVDTREAVTATITELKQDTEEYRTLKGRKRTRENYYVSYAFTLNDDEFSNTVEISRSSYGDLTENQDIDVWYPEGEPHISALKTSVESAVANNTTAGNMLSVAPLTAVSCLVLYWLSTLMFVRESKKALPEGFYTEVSWLDIDDRYLVALDGRDLVYFPFNDKLTLKLQAAYQQGAPLDQLIALSKDVKVSRIPLTEITSLVSDHNSDVIIVTHNEKRQTVEFLNQTVKAHALDRIRKLLPSTLDYSKEPKTRLQATLSPMIALVLLVGFGYWLDMLLVNLVIGFLLLVWTIPRIFSRLIDPTITEKWCATESAMTDQAVAG